jgi:hypothetical protein
LQYLYYLLTGQEALLTARADVPLLLRTSRIIVRDVASEQPKGKDLHLFRATVRNRLVWLSRFFHVQIPEHRERRLWRLLVGGAVFVVAALIAVQVIDALAYHPTWIERRQLAEATLAAEP